MKELQEKQIDRQEVKAEAPDDRTVFICPTQLHPGHTMFQIELATGIISEVQFEEVNFSMLTNSVRKKLVRKPGFMYIPALNWKNADKKFFKLMGLKRPK